MWVDRKHIRASKNWNNAVYIATVITTDKDSVTTLISMNKKFLNEHLERITKALSTIENKEYKLYTDEIRKVEIKESK